MCTHSLSTAIPVEPNSLAISTQNRFHKSLPIQMHKARRQHHPSSLTTRDTLKKVMPKKKLAFRNTTSNDQGRGPALCPSST